MNHDYSYAMRTVVGTDCNSLFSKIVGGFGHDPLPAVFQKRFWYAWEKIIDIKFESIDMHIRNIVIALRLHLCCTFAEIFAATRWARNIVDR